MSGPVDNPFTFRPETDPAKILQERREDVIANSARTPVRYADLTPSQQGLFERQLTAYRAAIHLIRACDEGALTGQAVHGDIVTVWLLARARWHQARNARPRFRERPLT